jgi:hypothetical protein
MKIPNPGTSLVFLTKLSLNLFLLDLIKNKKAIFLEFLFD